MVVKPLHPSKARSPMDVTLLPIVTEVRLVQPLKVKPSMDVTVLKDKTQITIVNNEKLYNFLSLVTHRTRKREETLVSGERK